MTQGDWRRRRPDRPQPSASELAATARRKSRAIREACGWPYVWWVRSVLPERFGRPCRVLVWGRKNSVLVQFKGDDLKVVTSRNYVRRAETR